MSIFHYQNNLFTKSSFRCQTDVSTLYKNNKNIYFNCLLAYNFGKMTASPSIRTQGVSIPVEHINHSPKSLGGSPKTTYIIIRLTVSLSTLFQSNTWKWPLGVTVETGVEMFRSLDTFASTASVATFTWTLFASIRLNSFWLTNPNIVFTWTLNKVIGLMWAFICHKLLIGFNLLTCAHCMNIQSSRVLF